MTITAELADGRRLEFPDETDPAIVQATVKRVLGVESTSPAPASPGAGAQLARQAGLGTRYAAEGLAGIPGIFANPITATANLAKYGSNKLFGTDFQRTPLPTEAFSSLLTRAGLPTEQTPEERIAGGISRAVSGAGGGMIVGKAAEAAPGLLGEIGKVLQAQPKMQAASAVTGGGAAAGTRELGGGPGAQLAAGLLGAVAPAGVAGGAAAATRGFVRGGEAGQQDFLRRLGIFQEAGVTAPSVGMVSGSRPIQQAESGLAQVSASSGVLDRTAEKIARDMGAKVDSLAEGMAPKASATKAGLTIERGIGGFVDRFRQEQNQLYGQLDNYLPADARVPVANISAKLDQMTTPIPGAEATSARLQSPSIVAIKEALAKDAAGGTMPQVYTLGASGAGTVPYGAIKQLRTMIGEKLSNPSLVDDIPTAQWKQLYGALSEDMAAAATQAGPQAKAAFDRANLFTRAGHQRIEDVLNRVAGKDTAEKIFQAAVSPSEVRQGATTVSGVMKSLLPDERKMVTAAVVRRMGIANPGQQNELGEQFSSATFLTNWNKIAPEAKAVLFPDQTLRHSLDQVAAASQMIRQGSKIFANPSGTAPAISNQLTRWTMAGAVVMGRPDLAATVGSLLLGANLSARLLTKPEFVRWLAESTRTPKALAPMMVNNITRIAQDWSPEDQTALKQALSQTSGPGTQ